jgi:hypothetical protein
MSTASASRAEPHVESAARDAIQRGQRLRQHRSGAQRLTDDERAEPWARDRARQGGQRGQRLEDTLALLGSAVLGDVEEEVVGEPQRVEAERFGPLRVMQERLPPQRRFAGHRVVVLGQRQADTHDNRA